MKLQFKDQEYQNIAVKAVVDLFKGQEKTSSNFEIVVKDRNGQKHFLQNDLGISNKMMISKETLQDNLKNVQRKHSLELTTIDHSKFPQFTIEMETGTGKTFVYTKSIYELNKKYGFTKFIVVVPSVAIREGVSSSLRSTNEYFSIAYNNTPMSYFIYNSKQPLRIKQFATSNNIEIMIINIDAFVKEDNIIKRPHEKLQDETAISFIQQTNPVVIIDESQSVDNTDKRKDAIASLNPLMALRYSATHREKINLLYRLTPVDAYQMGLVKQICVSSNEIERNFNSTYIKLLQVSKSPSGFRAKVEIDVLDGEYKTHKKTITVKNGDDLFALSGEREIYEGFVVNGITTTKDKEYIEFDNAHKVKLGQTFGNVDDIVLKEAQIRRTIRTHLEKELTYMEQGIKVLSLFFIDKVEKYRKPNGEKGEYALIFERCYNDLINHPDYAMIKQKTSSTISEIHNGYFSQDKKGWKDTTGVTLADDDTYNLIMKDKEKLLDFKSPLRFIFSHSALKEGWDNPNVFQICTLIDNKNSWTQRQKIGRGLRLCRNQEGERIDDKDINILHVMANESFAEFASTLQTEYEQDTGTEFGIIQISMFNGLKIEVKEEQQIQATEREVEQIVDYMKNNGYITEDLRPTEKIIEITQNDEVEKPKQIRAAMESIVKAIDNNEKIDTTEILGKEYTQTVIVEKTLNYEEAVEIIDDMKDKGYISKAGKMKGTLKEAVELGTFNVLEKYNFAKDKFIQVIQNTTPVPPIRDAKKEVKIKLKKQVLENPAFTELWNKIKQKTTYRVNFDIDKLKENCIEEINKMPKVTRAVLNEKTAEIDILGKGVSYNETEFRTINLDIKSTFIPNILGIIALETTMKKQDVYEIITKSTRLNDFYSNPQEFLERTLEIIKRCRQKLAIQGIKYLKLEGQNYYIQQVFSANEIHAYLDKNAIEVKNSLYTHIRYDSSTVERPFALALDNDENVKMFFKIPNKFKIRTPLGNYNPDWAVLYNKNGEEKLYIVVETKGDENNLRTSESLKKICGEEHFKALENGTQYFIETNWADAKTKF